MAETIDKIIVIVGYLLAILIPILGLIAGIVLDAMEDNSKIPHASKIDEISFEELEKNLDIENWNYKSKFKTYIVVDISKFAEKWGKELVKKTVNIPKWVNSKAESLKINFSKTLEEALLKHQRCCYLPRPHPALPADSRRRSPPCIPARSAAGDSLFCLLCPPGKDRAFRGLFSWHG